MIHHVPSFLQPKHPIKYPGDNHVEFERWFFDNFRPTKNLGRVYLPILWTNYYCANGYGKDITSLQRYLKTLPPGKYFTICQYDDGILNDLSGHDIRVYSMSGRPMDYPLPLICMPHNVTPAKDKLMQVNFIGRNTHPIRQQILNLRKERGWYISQTSHTMRRFCEVLSQSVFTLCPRGYGPTSFRIMEALQMGSIPVYISDRFIIPHAIPFEEYGVLIRPDQISDMPSILRDIDPDTKKKDVFNKYFSYIANQSIIFDDLIKQKHV